jgi:hypothetical protein
VNGTRQMVSQVKPKSNNACALFIALCVAHASIDTSRIENALTIHRAVYGLCWSPNACLRSAGTGTADGAKLLPGTLAGEH